MKKLRIGADGFSLEPGAAEDVVAILGRRGRGKTNTAVVFVEELHDAGARFCVADPVGVWWGLKSSKDGRTAGIPVVVMGGDRGDRRDVPLEDTAGRVIADFVADPTSPSVVLDFRGFRKAQMTRFMADFLEQLYQRNREPLHLVLDEADQFAPQRVMGETARLVGAAEDVCKMGRARGLHPMVITQRPAALNKNVLTQAGLLVCHQLTGPQDQKAVDEWIRANADEGQREKFLTTIPELGRGTAWFWQPELPIFQQVLVRERRTFDSSATPKRGEERKGPRVLAEVDLEALKKQIASTIEKAKAVDPAELQKTIRELRAQLAKAQAAKPAAAPAPAKAPKTIETLVVKDAQVKRLEAAAARIDRAMEQLGKWAQLFTGTEREVRNVGAEIKAALGAARGENWRVRFNTSDGGADGALRPAAGAGRASEGASRGPAALPGRERRPAPIPTGDGDGRISGPQQKILDAAAFLESVGIRRPDIVQLALFAGLSASGGYWRANIGRLRTLGLIDGTSLTGAGRAAAREAEITTVAELHDHVLTNLLTGPQRTILKVLIDAYPVGLSRDELGKRANLEPAGGYWRANLGRLRSLGLVSKREPIQALPVLFLEGA